ncbi:hypothetical protein ACH4YO_32395 [Streptomyces noursei]|uniref:hypothetical protein n=1 Tax=Streptomyces noursei TaxID=1971 RepID=UPI0033C3DDA8
MTLLAADEQPTRRQRALYAAGYLAAGLGMFGGSVTFGALEWAAARGNGTATGSLQIEHCEMRPATRSGQKRVCLGAFRASNSETVDDRAEVDSENGREGQSIAVTRTLIGDYIRHDGDAAAKAMVWTLAFGAIGTGCTAAGVHHARRGLKPQVNRNGLHGPE